MRGVYVHFDGYPEGRLPVLHELIARDGVDKVVSTLLKLPHGWSYLDHEAVYDQGHDLVAGYGARYPSGDDDYRTPEDVFGDIFIEYLYVIEEDGYITWAENDYTACWNKQRWFVSNGSSQKDGKTG